MTKKKREVVIPGQLLGNAKKNKSGDGTFVKDGKIYSEITGIINERKGYLNVKPVEGKYSPKENNFVIGIVEIPLSSCWLVDINAPSPALLHVSEVSWHVEFGEVTKYLNEGDCIMAEITEVDAENKIQITMDNYDFHKIKEGIIIDIQPSKIPRIIGKKGSMISLLKKYTKTRIFVGQNGRVWIDGEDEGIEKVIQAIRIIEEESLSYGLTNKIENFLKK